MARDAARPTTRALPGASGVNRWVWIGGGAAAVLLVVGTGIALFGPPGDAGDGQTAAARDGGAPATTATNGDGDADPAGAPTSVPGVEPSPAPTPTVAPPPPDPGPAVRAEALALLEHDDAAKAVALLTTRLVEDPEDGEALALRGRANIARGEAAQALADLDAAKALLHTESEPVADARAQACWALAQAALAQHQFDATVHEHLDCALQRSHVLPRPVDPVGALEPLIRGGKAIVQGWPELVAEVVPEGPLRSYLRVSERLSRDPTPEDEAAVYAATRAHYPRWADPMAREAWRLRATGDADAARALLDDAAGIDPDHPGVALTRCCFELLDGQARAIPRAIEVWARTRGSDPHAQRLFYFSVRDRLRQAGAPLPAATVALRYLVDAEDQALQPVLQFFFTDLDQTLRADLQAFADGPAPTGRTAALHTAVRGLLGGGDPAAIQAAAATALADDPTEQHRLILGALAVHDRRNVLRASLGELALGRRPYERMAETALALARAIGARRDLDTARGWTMRAINICPDPERVIHAIETYGGVLTQYGSAEHCRAWLQQIQPWTDPAAINESVGLAACLWSARLYERLEEWESARNSYTQAMDAAPDDPNPLVWRANFALRRGEPQRARLDLDTLVQLHPTFAVGFFVRGVCSQTTEQWAEAHTDYHAALKLGGGTAAGVCEALAGFVALREGDPDHAMRHLDQVARQRADGAKLAFLVRGWHRYTAGDHGAAAEDFADCAMLPASTWERELPLAALLAEPAMALTRHLRAVTDVLLARAERAFEARERSVAATALNACAGMRDRDEGRFQYNLARWHAPRGEAGAPTSLQALERAYAAGYTAPNGFGAEPEFDALREFGRFRSVVEQAAGR